MGKPKLTLNEMQQIASSRGGECLSVEYIRGVDKLEWRCEVGHIWSATGDAIKQGSWCPLCARERGRQLRMLGIENCREIAQEHGGKCLSSIYDGGRKYLLWECSKGHEWSAPPSSIRAGHWCLTCANEKKSRENTTLSIDAMCDLAEKKGGRCLSKKYRNVYHCLKWQCALGHEWETAPANIIAGHWCPKCGRGLSERLCRAIFSHLFAAQFPSVRPKWLIGERGNPLELDGYCEQYKVAFEYQGAQHFIPVKQFKQCEERLVELQARDEQKRRLCIQYGVTLIEIPYTISHEDLEKYIRKQLSFRGFELQTRTEIPRLDIANVEFLVDPRLEFYKELANQRGGKCLSTQYLGQMTKLRWRCANGHEWLGYPKIIRKGGWCRTCFFEMEATRHKAETFAKINAYVSVRGERLLSTKFEGHNMPLQLICDKGHTWSTSWASLRLGTKCPDCRKIGYRGRLPRKKED